MEGIRAHRRIAAMQIVVLGQVGVPKTIVQKAKEKKEELKKSKDHAWKIYVVFDRDDHPRFAEALRQSEELGFVVGVSVPCFELWALLLHQDQTAHLTPKRAQELLQNVHPGYSHESKPVLDVQTVIDNYGKAKIRATELRLRAQEAGDRWNNPVTTFDLVLDALFGELR